MIKILIQLTNAVLTYSFILEYTLNTGRLNL